MTDSPSKSVRDNSERGGAGVKFLIVIVILFCVAHAGYSYIPVAYQGEDYKQKMTEIVLNAYAMPNALTNSPEVVKQRLRNYANDNGIPTNAFIKVDKVETEACAHR